jgi:hypothetical protein
MKERVKWIAIGFGFMVGIQVLASLLLIGLAQMLKASPNLVLEPYWVFVVLGLTLGAFFLGPIRDRFPGVAGRQPKSIYRQQVVG